MIICPVFSINQLMQAVLEFWSLGFHINHTFVHYKFSPRIHLSYAEFRIFTQLMNEHLKHSHNGAVKLSFKLYFVSTKCQKGQSQWLRRLRHGYMATCLLRLCVFRCLCDGPITGQSSPTKCGVSRVGITQGYFTCYSRASLAAS
jgi:hypothetical protein